MEFCPKCGAMLIQKLKNSGCPRCSYSSKSKINLKSSESIKIKKEATPVVKKETQIFPIIKEKCKSKKCDNDAAYFWTVQTRAGDEAETKFFKCTKCKHTWREYR